MVINISAKYKASIRHELRIIVLKLMAESEKDSPDWTKVGEMGVEAQLLAMEARETN